MITKCQKCYKWFNIPPSTIKRGGGKFCNLKCYRDKQRNGVEVNKTCLVCKKNYIVSPSRLKIEKGKYCSKKCFIKNSWVKYRCFICRKRYQRQKSQRGKHYCSWKCYLKSCPRPKIKNCLCCKKEIIVYLFRLKQKRGKYCSKKCYYLSLIKTEEHKKNRQREYLKRYRKENPDWYTEVKHRRRAREFNAEGFFTHQEWQDMKKSHNYRCAICKCDKKLTVDHIIPLSKGGTNNKNNIQPLCGSCNSRKSNKFTSKEIVRTA